MAKSNIALNQYNMAKIFTQFKDKNGNYVFNINDTVTIDLTDTSTNLYRTYIITSKDTYQTISYKMYGTTRLWWVLAKLNNVTDATILPTPGDTIIVLNPSMINLISSNLN